MADTGRMAVFHGTGKPFEIREYPVPDPEPGAALIKIALANVCGSDMHYWRGEQDYARMGRPLPLNTGHEHVGIIAKLGDGVKTDAAGRPVQVGERVAYRYFFPCGRCKACLARHFKSCPVRQANWLCHASSGRTSRAASDSTSTCVQPRHVQAPRRSRTRWRPAWNCAFTHVYAGLDVAGYARTDRRRQGAGGLACMPARWRARWAPAA